MLFRCSLKVVGGGRSQESPFRFKTKEECQEFGKASFEPPQSVLSWEIKEERANFQYKNGQLTPL